MTTVNLPEGWYSATDEHGDTYYYDSFNHTQWEVPTEPARADGSKPSESSQPSEPSEPSQPAASTSPDSGSSSSSPPQSQPSQPAIPAEVLKMGAASLSKRISHTLLSIIFFPHSGTVPLIIYWAVRWVWSLILIITGFASLVESTYFFVSRQGMLILDGFITAIQSLLYFLIFRGSAGFLLSNPPDLNVPLSNIFGEAGGSAPSYTLFFCGCVLQAVYRIYCIILAFLEMFSLNGSIETRKGKLMYFIMLVLGADAYVNVCGTALYICMILLLIAVRHHAPKVLNILSTPPHQD